MNTEITEIRPVEMPITLKIAYYKIVVDYIELKSHANIRVIFYDDKQTVIRIENLRLDGSGYDAWNNDDYLIKYIELKYGFTPTDTEYEITK